MITAILKNANVYTLDPSLPRASNIAILNDRIVAAGGDEVLDLKEARTRVFDMEGAMVLPAFCDAHIHWSWTALNMRAVDLFDVPDKEEALRLVGEAVRKAEPGEWIYGFGWAQGIWPDGRFPTAADLDRVAPENPVYLPARSGHATWVNSLALRLAGVGPSTPDPEGGEIQRDARGNPTGILLEDASRLVERLVPKNSPEDIATAVEEAQPAAWRSGLGSLHDYDGPDAFAAFQILRDRKKLGLRIMKNINDQYIQHAHGLGLRSGFGDKWLRIGGLKIFADGALGSVTACMIDPYEGEKDYRGLVVTPKEKIEELVLNGTRQGFFSTIHAIGDQAVRDVLDVIERARVVEGKLGIPRTARRHRIEHFQVVHPDDLNRAAELDVTVSIQPIHATADYPMVDKHWGERGRWSYNPRPHIDQGAHVVFGSDAPVEPFDPLKGIHAAVTRRRPDGSPGGEGWWPEARTTVDEAIRCYTTEPAWSSGMDDELGRILPGYLADFAVLDRDLYKVDPDELLGVNVLGTMVGGEWRHGPWAQ